MKNLLTAKEIENYKSDGAIVLREKFDISWIEKLKIGIKKDIKYPSLDLNPTQYKKIFQLI